MIQSLTQILNIPTLVSRDFVSSEFLGFFYNCSPGHHPVLRHNPTILPAFLCHIFPAISLEVVSKPPLGLNPRNIQCMDACPDLFNRGGQPPQSALTLSPIVDFETTSMTFR